MDAARQYRATFLSDIYMSTAKYATVAPRGKEERISTGCLGVLEEMSDVKICWKSGYGFMCMKV
jgi:hypothetical protein